MKYIEIIADGEGLTEVTEDLFYSSLFNLILDVNCEEIGRLIKILIGEPTMGRRVKMVLPFENCV